MKLNEIDNACESSAAGERFKKLVLAASVVMASTAVLVAYKSMFDVEPVEASSKFDSNTKSFTPLEAEDLSLSNPRLAGYKLPVESASKLLDSLEKSTVIIENAYTSCIGVAVDKDRLLTVKHCFLPHEDRKEENLATADIDQEYRIKKLNGIPLEDIEHQKFFTIPGRDLVLVRFAEPAFSNYVSTTTYRACEQGREFYMTSVANGKRYKYRGFEVRSSSALKCEVPLNVYPGQSGSPIMDGDGNVYGLITNTFEVGGILTNSSQLILLPEIQMYKSFAFDLDDSNDNLGEKL